MIFSFLFLNACLDQAEAKDKSIAKIACYMTYAGVEKMEITTKRFRLYLKNENEKLNHGTKDI